jgi:hypothetical protein
MVSAMMDDDGVERVRHETMRRRASLIVLSVEK